jgi:hypothetical protein
MVSKKLPTPIRLHAFAAESWTLCAVDGDMTQNPRTNNDKMNTMAPIISVFFLFVFTPSENKKKP